MQVLLSLFLLKLVGEEKTAELMIKDSPNSAKESEGHRMKGLETENSAQSIWGSSVCLVNLPSNSSGLFARNADPPNAVIRFSYEEFGVKRVGGKERGSRDGGNSESPR